MKKPAYTLLVNTCDNFDDCWEPFFKLFSKYWGDQELPVLLNTELKQYEYPGVSLKSSQVQRNIANRLTWSQCLDRALAQVETPLVLYMQEDYFIENSVDVERINQIAQLMLDNPDIKHVGLTHFGSGGPFSPSKIEGLDQISRFASYRISTQAGLWRVPTLRSYVLPWESGWMFELYGTFRAWKRQENFLTVSRQNETPPIQYQHTGIVKGKWSGFIPELFAKEGIQVDLSKRGFFDDKGSAFIRRLQLLRSVMKSPVASIRSILA